jgi:glycosyltransferase involved in cell wall biosynthesis
MKLSVIIKTLNEEGSISRAIESALVAIGPYTGEVIVADGGSTDRTSEIAMRYPITVVQLRTREEQCCGIGPQLGYKYCCGRYIYICDGDMELDARFVQEAIDLLDREASIGGVGGIVAEKVVSNIEFKNRARHFADRQVPHGSEVDCLTGGGVYRRTAIQEVSYLSDRNLHGFEEYDLGVRMRSKGWRLVRLESHAVDHYSHSLGTYALLWYRLRAGRLLAIGEILRAAIECDYLRNALVELRPIRFALGMLVYWPVVCLLALAFLNIPWRMVLLLVAAGLPIAAMTVRGGSLKAGIYSVVVWHLTSITLLLGFMRPRMEPNGPISSVVLRTADRNVGSDHPVERSNATVGIDESDIVGSRDSR